MEPGATRLTVTFCAFPERFLPSEGATAEFGAAYCAASIAPGLL